MEILTTTTFKLHKIMGQLKERIERNSGLGVIHSRNGNNFEGWLQIELCDIICEHVNLPKDIFVETKNADIETNDSYIMLKMFSSKNRYFNGISEDIQKLKTDKKKFLVIVIFPKTLGFDNVHLKKGLNLLKDMKTIPFTFTVSGIEGIINYGEV